MEKSPRVKKPRWEAGKVNRDESKGADMTEGSDCRVKWPSVPMLYEYKGGAFFYERECYAEYYTLIESLVLARAKVVTVTGTPGIGKSVFYGYFFDRFRREHPEICIVAVAFSNCLPGDVLIYKGDGKEPVYHDITRPAVAERVMQDAADEAIALRRYVVYLCDGRPDYYLRKHSAVVFSSPSEELLRSTEKFEETYFMPLWTREELYQAACVLDLPIGRRHQPSSHDDLTTCESERQAEIDARFDIFGGVARFCLHPDAAKVLRAVKNLEIALSTIRDLVTLATLLEGKSPEKVRHRLLHYEPPENDRSTRTTKLASLHVAKKLAENMLTKYRWEREHLRQSLRTLPEAASLCGVIFECETHDKLAQGCPLKLRRLIPATRPVNEDPQMELVTIMPTNQPNTEFRVVVKSMLTHGPYHQPKSKVWESIDAFYLPTMPMAAPQTKDIVEWNAQPENRLLLFQITVSMTHDVNVVGVLDVLGKLGLLESVAAHPERAALVFVVPKDIVREFTHQKIVVPMALGSDMITSIAGIADKTAAVLGLYGIRTIDELQDKIKAYESEAFSVRAEHMAAWMRALRCGVKHGLVSDGTQFSDKVATIPQYVCAWEDGTGV